MNPLLTLLVVLCTLTCHAVFAQHSLSPESMSKEYSLNISESSRTRKYANFDLYGVFEDQKLQEPVAKSSGLWSFLFGKKQASVVARAENFNASASVLYSSPKLERLQLVNLNSSFPELNFKIEHLNFDKFVELLGPKQADQLGKLCQEMKTYTTNMLEALNANRRLREPSQYVRAQLKRDLFRFATGNFLFFIKSQKWGSYVILKSSFLTYVMQEDLDASVETTGESDLNEVFSSWKLWTVRTLCRKRYAEILAFDIFSGFVNVGLSGFAQDVDLKPVQKFVITPRKQVFSLSASAVSASFYKESKHDDNYLPKTVTTALAFLYFNHWHRS